MKLVELLNVIEEEQEVFIDYFDENVTLGFLIGHQQNLVQPYLNKEVYEIYSPEGSGVIYITLKDKNDEKPKKEKSHSMQLNYKPIKEFYVIDDILM